MSPAVVAQEALPDGRTLLEYDDGSIAVCGLSNRPAEAARMGYLGTAVRRARPAPTGRRAGATTRRSPRRVPRPDSQDPWDVAERLLESLLDSRQRADKRRYGRWWVEVDRGWLQLGQLHDIRFRSFERPSVEESLCVVAADDSLPPGDIWSTLLLTATGLPDTFFRVANRRPAPTAPKAPAPPTTRSSAPPPGTG